MQNYTLPNLQIQNCINEEYFITYAHYNVYCFKFDMTVFLYQLLLKDHDLTIKNIQR